MTMWDFLAQAGFWNWIGILLLASIVCKWANAARNILRCAEVSASVMRERAKEAA